ncbi:MAG TPA: GrpB family protein [Acidimicrobiales bacterium]
MSSQPPVVVAYRADWPERAASLLGQLETTLQGRVDRIDHIGSTAIAGMAAKDLLDLQASVDDLAVAGRELDEPLAVLGFTPSPYRRDHVPAGRNDDPSAWEKRLWVRRDHDDGDVNLHVRRAGSPNERLALLFRDWFRAHPDAVPAYAAFKRALAGTTPDTEVYADVKDPVVDLVMVTAEAWALSVGWRP